MVLKSEATCPKCFTRYQYCFKLLYDDARKRFFCPNDAHVFVEDENGFLKSQWLTKSFLIKGGVVF